VGGGSSSVGMDTRAAHPSWGMQLGLDSLRWAPSYNKMGGEDGSRRLHSLFAFACFV
jgi:hypothetical protein